MQAQDRKELTDFASLELSTTAVSEQALAGKVAELEGQLAEHMFALDSTKAQLSGAHTALAQVENKVSLDFSQAPHYLHALKLPTGLHQPSRIYQFCHLCPYRMYTFLGTEIHVLALCCRYRQLLGNTSTCCVTQNWFEQVEQLTTAHSSCTEMAEKAQKELRVLRGTCQQLTHDRMQSIANVRKAESEVHTGSRL